MTTAADAFFDSMGIELGYSRQGERVAVGLCRSCYHSRYSPNVRGLTCGLTDADGVQPVGVAPGVRECNRYQYEPGAAG